jgi:HlyD family secretion protein
MDVPRAPIQRTRRRLLAGAAGICLLVGLSVGSLALRPAAPSVDRDTLWLGTVQRGPMLREVLGQGTLVPESIYWLTARSSAQVVRVLQKPGALVKSDTLIVELTNAELELAALEAERELSRAEAELVNLEATLNAERLGRESALATLTSELADAVRRARADEELGRRGFLSELEQGQTLGHEKELRGRLEFEQKRLGVLARGTAAQVVAQKSQIERLEGVMFMGRPAVGQPGTSASLFKLDPDGSGAERTPVQLGRSSVENVEVVSGLREGDRVILSELSQLNEVDRIRLH